MKKFLFIPPVDDSLPPLKAGQWALLFASFLLSLAIFTLFVLTSTHHGVAAAMYAFAFGIMTMPMFVYAQNRSGRIILIVFGAIVLGGCLWVYKEARNPQDFSSVLLIIAGVGWLTWCIDKAVNILMERLTFLQRRIDSVESKLDDIESALHKTKPKTEEVQIR